jgi:hypothetical protein
MTRFLNDLALYLHICDYLPLEKDRAHYLKKLEFPLPKDYLYQIWLKLAKWFWRRFKNNFQCTCILNLLFCYYLPLKNGIPLYLIKLESSSMDNLGQVCLNLAMWFWRRNWKCKSLPSDKWWTMGGQKISNELSAQVS